MTHHYKSYTLYCGTSLRRVSKHCRAEAPTQAYHTYTHTLLGDEGEEVTGSNGPPVKLQEYTAVLSCCWLTRTSLHVSLLGLGGKEGSVCGHSVSTGRA